MKPWKKRVFTYGIALTLLLVFLLWAYLTMINIRPTVERPEMDKETEQVIYNLENRLRRHVIVLAREIGERNLSVPANLDKAADYIQKFWYDIGYEVKSQSYQVYGVECVNLAVEIPGKESPDEIILLGAHYDSVDGSPGANDNCSAVAALLEIIGLKTGPCALLPLPMKSPRFSRAKGWEAGFMRKCVGSRERILRGWCAWKPLVITVRKPGARSIHPHLVSFILIRAILSR